MKDGEWGAQSGARAVALPSSPRKPARNDSAVRELATVRRQSVGSSKMLHVSPVKPAKYVVNEHAVAVLPAAMEMEGTVSVFTAAQAALVAVLACNVLGNALVFAVLTFVGYYLLVELGPPDAQLLELELHWHRGTLGVTGTCRYVVRKLVLVYDRLRMLLRDNAIAYSFSLALEDNMALRQEDKAEEVEVVKPWAQEPRTERQPSILESRYSLTEREDDDDDVLSCFSAFSSDACNDDASDYPNEDDYFMEEEDSDHAHYPVDNDYDASDCFLEEDDDDAVEYPIDEDDDEVVGEYAYELEQIDEVFSFVGELPVVLPIEEPVIPVADVVAPVPKQPKPTPKSYVIKPLASKSIMSPAIRQMLEEVDRMMLESVEMLTHADATEALCAVESMQEEVSIDHELGDTEDAEDDDPAKPRRSVHFCEDIDVQDMPELHDFDDDDLAGLFYGEAELDAMCSEYFATALPLSV